MTDEYKIFFLLGQALSNVELANLTFNATTDDGPIKDNDLLPTFHFLNLATGTAKTKAKPSICQVKDTVFMR